MKYLLFILAIGLWTYLAIAYYGDWRRCQDAGGRPVYEHNISPSCWSEDGRRIFP